MSDLGDPTCWTDREREFFAAGWNECLKMQPGEAARLRARAEAAEAERAALDSSHKALGKQLAEVGRELDKMREALKECADDLEASVNAEYAGMLDYPSMARKHARDMEPVKKARALLGVQQQPPSKES